MRLVQRSQTTNTSAAAADSATEQEPVATGYSAEEAAIAFGFPRIAPIVTSRVASQPGVSDRSASAAGFVAGEDVTESLTGDERAAGFVDHGGQGLHELQALAAPVEEISDPITAALRVPGHHRPEARSEWGRAQPHPHTERLVVPANPTLPPTRVAKSARQTAVLPHLGRGPEEAATTTVTLPPGVAAPFTDPSGHGGASHARIAKAALVGAITAAILLGAVLAGRALTLADLWPGAAARPLASRPPELYRQRLLEQATAALRDGRREQAVGLLLRYQASEPAGSADRTVEIMLRVLKKDLGTPAR